MTGSRHIDEDLDALAQSVLDGTADDEARARLQARLEDDPDLRLHYQRLQDAFVALRQLSTVEPPEEIRRELRAQVAEGPVQRSRAARHSTERHRPARSPRPAPREVLAFLTGAAAVALLALLAPGLLHWTDPDPEQSSGTLLTRQPGTEIADSWSWSEPWGKGDAVLRTTPEGSRLEIDFRSTASTTIAVAFAGEEWSTASFSSERRLMNTRFDRGGRVEIEAGERNRVFLDLRPPFAGAPTPLQVELGVAAGRDGVSGRLSAPAPRAEAESDTNF